MVRVEPETGKAEEKLAAQVARFISRQSIELADSRYAADTTVESIPLKSSATVWRTATVDSIVSLLESVSATDSSAADVTSRPLVSVIVTSFNRPQMLRQTVLSIQKQTYTNIEVIVVDDGSTTALMEPVLASLESQKVRIRKDREH